MVGYPESFTPFGFSLGDRIIMWKASNGNGYVRSSNVDDGIITAMTSSLICLNVLLVISFVLFLSVVFVSLL